MLNPIRAVLKGKKIVIACVHWRTFPPGLAFEDRPAEDLWREGKAKQEDFQRYLVWKRICGRKMMTAEACLLCDCVRIVDIRTHVPCLTTLDGKTSVPTTDIPTQEVLPTHRGNLIKMIRPKKDGPNG